MKRRAFLTLSASGVGVLAGCSSKSDTSPATASETPLRTQTGAANQTPGQNPDTIFVGPNGSNTNPGTNTAPVASIQQALDQAQPGEQISVKAGRYFETFRTKRSGEAGSPITITGPRDAVIRPPKNELDGRIFDINHNHIYLKGLTLNGLADSAQQTNPDQHVDTIIECRPVEWADYAVEYLTDVKIMPRAIGNCRRAMIQHIRTNQLEVGEFEVIGPAGVQHLYGDKSGHTGEVVYLGTAPDNLQEDWYSWDGPDESHDIHVHHIDNSAGHPHTELVDVKAGCYNVLIEYCTDGGGAGRYVLEGNSETSETAFHLGGRENILRWSVVEDSNGQGVEIASWGVANREEFEQEKGLPYPEELFEHGRANSVYGNRFTNYAGLAVQYPVIYPDDGESYIAEGYGPDEQMRVCGNVVDGATHGTPEMACSNEVPEGDGIGHTGGENPWA